MSYTNIFGGNTIYPSDVSYLALALDADTALEWPLENSGALPPAARIIDVTPDAAGWAVTLPDATLTGAGQVILFNNLSGSDSFLVKDYAGNTLATVGFGEQWELYLAATTTAAGTWRVFRFGASTAGVQPSSLAGFGLTVTGSTLSQAAPVTTFNTTGLNVASSNRASAFVWEGTGAGTINLPTAVGVGNNFFIFVRNEGGGDLTVEPAGTEVINGAVNLALRPGDSATVITDGVKWYTIGLGQEAVFAFDYTSITVTGGNYSLAGSELNRIAYKFVGTLTSDVYIIVPSTIQQYWVNNQTTGAFNFFIKTLTGPATQINQGAKGIYYCDGLNMVLGSDPTTLTTPIVVSDGGTGAVTASGARLNLGITAFADPIVTATSGATVRTVIGAASSGVNNDISELTGLTTPLSVAQGGTGSTTASGARTNLGLGTMATQNANNIAVTGGTMNAVAITGGSVSGITDLAVADGGTGASDAATARTNLGLGTISTQNANNVAITGGAISGVTLSTTGTPTAPTAAYGTNNTQIATTAFVQAALQALYPIGSVYINAAVTTNPATLFGFGTWIEIGAGRVLVGQNAADASFDTLGETGGSKDAIVVSHSHTASASVYDPGHAHQQRRDDNFGAQGTSGGNPDGGYGSLEIGPTSPSLTGISVGVTVNAAGSSGTNANLQPYIVVKMWQRTA